MKMQSIAKACDGLSVGLHSVRGVTGLCVGHQKALVPICLLKTLGKTFWPAVTSYACVTALQSNYTQITRKTLGRIFFVMLTLVIERKTNQNETDNQNNMLSKTKSTKALHKQVHQTFDIFN